MGKIEASPIEILIQGSLNKANTERAINEQLKEIASKIERLNIDIGIDKESIKSLQGLLKGTSDLTKEIEVNNKGIQEFVREYHRADGTIDRVTRRVDETGQVFTSTSKVIKESKKDLDRYREGIERLIRTVETLDKKGRTVSKLETYMVGDTIEERELVSGRTRKIVDEEKIIKSRERALAEEYKIRRAIQRAEEETARKSAKERERALAEEQKIRAAIQKTNEDLRHRLKIYQEEARIKKEDLERRYRRGSIDNQALEKWLHNVNRLSVDTPNLSKRMQELNVGFKAIEASARASGSRMITFGEQMKIALERVPIWMASMTLFYGTVRGIRDAIRQNIEIDTQMTELARVSNQEISRSHILRESIELAERLGNTIIDINEGIITFARMGFRGEGLIQLTEASTLFSNISELSVDEAADGLTAIINGFRMLPEEALSAVDAINEVDNNFAITSANIVSSMQKAVGAANTFGVSMHDLIGYTTAIGETTRESGNVIGNSLRTIFSRITTMQPAIDSLASIGVSIKDMGGNIRPVSEILTELAARWDKLTASQQQNIGLQIAGRYQLSRFLILMQNFDTAIAATEAAINSENSALIENQAYLESLEARLNRLKNAWTELTITMGETTLTDTLIGAVNVLVAFANIANTVVDNIGLIPPILAAVGISMLLFSNRFRGAMNTIIMSTNATVSIMTTVDKAVRSFGSSANLTAVGVRALSRAIRGLAIATGVGAVMAVAGFALEKLIDKFSEASDISGEYGSNLIQQSQITISNANKIEELASRYDELAPKARGSKDAQDELRKIMEQIRDIAPELTHEFNKVGDVFSLNTDKARDYAQMLRDMTKEQAEALSATIEGEVFLKEGELEKARRKLDSIYEDIESLLRKRSEIFSKYGVESAEEFIEAYKKAAREGLGSPEFLHDAFLIKRIMDELGESEYEDTLLKINELEGEVSGLRERQRQLRNVGKEIERVTQYQGKKIDSTRRVVEIMGRSVVINEGLTNAISESSESFEDATESAVEYSSILEAILSETKKVSDEIEFLNKVQKEIQETNTISIQTLEKLIEKYEDIVDVTNLNIQEIARYIREKESERIATIRDEREKTREVIESTKRRIEVLEQEIKALEALREARRQSFISDVTRSIPRLSETAGLGGSFEREFKDLLESTANPDEFIRDFRDRFMSRMSPFEFQKWMSEYGDVLSDTFAFGHIQGNIDDALKYLNELETALNAQDNILNSISKTQIDSSKSVSAERLIELNFARELARAYRDEYEAIKRIIQSIQHKINLTDDDNYYRLIDLQTKLVEEQERAVESLRRANSRLHEDANKLRQANPEIDKWFDSAAQPTEYYINLLESIRNNNDLTIEQRNKMIEQIQDMFNSMQILKQAHIENTQEIINLQSAINGAEEAIEGLYKTYRQSVFDRSEEWIQRERKRIEIASAERIRAARRQGATEEEISKINAETELEVARMVMEARRRMAEDNWAVVNGLEKLTIEERERAAHNLYLAELEYYRLLQRSTDEASDRLEKAARQAIDVMKEYYRTQQRYARDAINEEISNLEKAHRRKMQMLDEELNSYREMVNERLQSIDRAEEERNFDKQLAEAQREAQEIRNKISLKSLNDSLEARYELEKLEEELAKKLEEIEEIKHRRSLELRRKNLQDSLKTREKEIEDERKNSKYTVNIYDKETRRLIEMRQLTYEHAKELLEKERDDHVQYWEDKITNERKFRQLIEEMTQGNFEEINRLFDEFANGVDKTLTNLSQNIKDNLIDRIEEARSALANAKSDLDKYKPTGAVSSNTGQGKYTEVHGEDEDRKDVIEQAHAQYIRNKLRWANLYNETGRKDLPEQIALNKMNEEMRRVYGFRDYTMDDILSGNIQTFKSGGYTGDGEGLAFLHRKEIILNEDDSDKFLKAVVIARDVVDNMLNRLKSGGYVTANTSNITERRTIVENLNIYFKSEYGKNDGRRFSSDLIKGLRSKGVII